MVIPEELEQHLVRRFIDGQGYPGNCPFFRAKPVFQNPGTVLLGLEGNSIAGPLKFQIEQRSIERVRHRILEAIIPQNSYGVKRVLSSTDDSHGALESDERAYECGLDIYPGLLPKLIRDYVGSRRGEILSALDIGCGLAVALDELKGIEGISADQSIGVTLPFPRPNYCEQMTGVYESVSSDSLWVGEGRRDIIIGNILGLIPKRRFDIVLSLRALSIYHPISKLFGIFQALNLAELGGLLLMDIANGGEAETVELVRRGVLRRSPNIREFNRFHGQSAEAYIVRERPSPALIREMLQISDNNVLRVV
jgi:hypothetical protein